MNTPGALVCALALASVGDAATPAAEFDKAAAAAALTKAATAAKACKAPGGPTGAGKVKVTFAPAGKATAVELQGPPYAGTPVGACVVVAFRAVQVPAFDGAPVVVSKTFTLD